MRNFVAKLIYRKWFYGFLALVLWLDCWTDLADVIDAASPREIISLVFSFTGALLVTLVFIDLHLRWPTEGR